MKKDKKNIFFSLVLIFTMVLSFSMDSFSESTTSTDSTDVVAENGRISVYLLTGKDVDVNGEKSKKFRVYPGIRVKIWKINDDSTEKADEKENVELKNKLDKMIEKSSDEKDTSKNTLDGNYPIHYEKTTNENGSAYFDNLSPGTYYIRSDKYKKKEKNDKEDQNNKSEGKDKEEDVDLDFVTSVCQVKKAENVDVFQKGVHHSTSPGGGGGGGGTTPTPLGSEDKGGKKFLKLDNDTKKGLSGAKFTISKLVKGNYEIVKKDGKDLILESDKDGKFEVKDLDYGTYYLTETVSPKNSEHVYGLLATPFKFDISKDSYTSSTLKIFNKPNFDNPAIITPEEEKPQKDKTESEKTAQEKKHTNKVSIPKTGDIQIYYYSIIGAVIFLIGMYMTKKESNNETGAVS